MTNIISYTEHDRMGVATRKMIVRANGIFFFFLSVVYRIHEKKLNYTCFPQYIIRYFWRNAKFKNVYIFYNRYSRINDIFIFLPVTEAFFIVKKNIYTFYPTPLLINQVRFCVRSYKKKK